MWEHAEFMHTAKEQLQEQSHMALFATRRKQRCAKYRSCRQSNMDTTDR